MKAQKLLKNKSNLGSVLVDVDNIDIELVKRSYNERIEEGINVTSLSENKVLDKKLENLRSEILKDVNTVMYQHSQQNDRINDLENTNRLLISENDFLKGQLKELTGFLDTLVSCFQRQNQCCGTSEKSSHSQDQIKTCNKLDASTGTNINNDVSNNEIINDTIHHFNDTIHQLTEQDNQSSNNEVKSAQAKESINEQLMSFRHEQKLKYESIKTSKSDIQNTSTKCNSPLKNRLEKLADYSTKKQPVTYILGDSIVKEVKGWELSNNLKRSHKVVVKSFSGAKIQCMRQYIKPSLSQKPDHVIIHIGTNDLASNMSADNISKSIIDLATSSANDHLNITVSGIVPRSDDLAIKAKEVNGLLQRSCNERNIPFIDHGNIDPSHHLNRSKLHLNKKGTKLISKTFTRHISKC